MDFKGDVRFLLLLGAGVIAASWALFYAGDVQQLVSTGTNGYITMVRGLEAVPPGSATAGAGGFSSNTGMLSGGGPYYSTGPYGMG